jgi:lysozyme family protein
VHCWPNLKSGDSGTKVKALQHCLTHRGYTTAADGNFGLLTKTAVTNFQKVATPQDVDGIAGPKTLSALVVTVNIGAKGSAVKAVQVCATHPCACYGILQPRQIVQGAFPRDAFELSSAPANVNKYR